MNEIIPFELPVKVSDIENLAINFVERVKESGQDPVKMMVNLKQVDEYVKHIKKYLKSYAVDYANKRQVDSCQGAKIELRSPATYDYTNCQDPIWNYFVEEIKRLDELKKSRENFLKYVTKPTEQIDEETGDIFTVNPPLVSREETLYITLLKK